MSYKRKRLSMIDEEEIEEEDEILIPKKKRMKISYLHVHN